MPQVSRCAASRLLFVATTLLAGTRLEAQTARVQQVSSLSGNRADDRFTSASVAWDAGRYVNAIDGFLALLNGPDSAVYLERIALISGEKWRTTLVAENARA